jgi:hypothetical protein
MNSITTCRFFSPNDTSYPVLHIQNPHSVLNSQHINLIRLIAFISLPFKLLLFVRFIHIYYRQQQFKGQHKNKKTDKLSSHQTSVVEVGPAMWLVVHAIKSEAMHIAQPRERLRTNG